jgi:hypothetical protein
VFCTGSYAGWLLDRFLLAGGVDGLRLADFIEAVDTVAAH